MKCNNCGKDFQEHLIEESHDVPCYLFKGNRQGRKNQADKYGRHQLCGNCHERYENELMFFLRIKAIDFCKQFFNKRGENDSISKV